MSTPFFNDVPFPKLTLGKVQSLNGIYRQEVTCDYTETVRAMNLELLNKTDEEILGHLIPHIEGTLLRAGWTPPSPDNTEASMREKWDQAVAKVNAAVEYLNRIGTLKGTRQQESTPGGADQSDWVMWNGTEFYPFVEHDNADITGQGHQDKASFAAAVTVYEVNLSGEQEPFTVWTADDVAHRWATYDPTTEILSPCDPETPGARPITTMWGKR